MGLGLPDGTSRYFSWGAPSGNNCSLADVIKWSRQELKHTPGRTAVGLNALFDMRMAHSVGIHLGDVVEDVGIACALLNEHEPGYDLGSLIEKYLGREKSDVELNQYCAKAFGGKPTRKSQAERYHKVPGDVIAKYGAADALDTLDLYNVRIPEIYRQGFGEIYFLETQIIPILHKMYWAGVKVDVERARKTKLEFDRLFKEKKLEWFELTGEDTNYGSGQQLAAVFDRFGIHYNYHEPTPAMAARGITRGNPHLDKHELAKINHPLARIIEDSRQYSHYSGTFIQNYVLNNYDVLHFIHPSFHSVKSEWGGTITGRFSSSGGLNAQNVPSRDEVLAPLIRAMFIPMDEDSQWLKIDYSQIEYRFFAHYAGGNILQQYIKNPDIDFHDMVAAMTGLSRKAAKSINFAKLYGAGDEKLAVSIGCSLQEAREFKRLYEERIPESKRLYNKAMNLGSTRGYMITWGGRMCRFRKMFGRYVATHAALNKVLQGSAADLIKEAMIRVDQLINWKDEVLHLTVHDELDLSVPKGQRGVKLAKQLKEAMEDFELRVPIRAEVELGPDWGHTEKHFKKAA